MRYIMGWLDLCVAARCPNLGPDSHGCVTAFAAVVTLYKSDCSLVGLSRCLCVETRLFRRIRETVPRRYCMLYSLLVGKLA